MNKHTSGPLVVKRVPTQIGDAFWVGPAEMIEAGKGICLLYNDRTTRNPFGDGVQEANAHLFAAAPDMLETLRYAYAFINPNDYPSVHEMIGSVITKACVPKIIDA